MLKTSAKPQKALAIWGPFSNYVFKSWTGRSSRAGDGQNKNRRIVSIFFFSFSSKVLSRRELSTKVTTTSPTTSAFNKKLQIPKDSSGPFPWRKLIPFRLAQSSAGASIFPKILEPSDWKTGSVFSPCVLHRYWATSFPVCQL